MKVKSKEYMALRDKLRSEVGITNINNLDPHHKRGALFEVDKSLDLIDVAHKIAIDDTISISMWLQNNMFKKVADSEIEIYKAQNNIYSFLIIQPYVLIKKIQKELIN